MKRNGEIVSDIRRRATGYLIGFAQIFLLPYKMFEMFTEIEKHET